MIKKNILYLLVFLICFSLNSEAKIFIVKKVNNQIITNLDVAIEQQYLKTLNPKTANLDPANFRKIAEESLVNEKIKELELLRYFEINPSDLPKDVFMSFIRNFNMKTEKEFEQFLKSKNLELKMVKKKIYVEFLWNSLIYNKYGKTISIDENKIRKKVLEISKKEKEKNFLLYELIYDIEDASKLNDKTSKIKKSIKDIGFESTVSIFSISETSKLGGKIGWINEAQISNIIFENIKNLKKGEISNPIKTMNGYMLLLLKDIKYSEKKININDEIKNMINYETNEKLKSFSLLHFNKVKINQKIN